MTTYRLMPKEGTCTFHKIVHGRKWVGRVYQMADSEWRATINKEVKGSGKTAVQAFEMAVSHHLGFSGIEQMQARNDAVQLARRIKRREGEELLNRYMSAPIKDQMKILDKFSSGELLEFMGAFTRDLGRR